MDWANERYVRLFVRDTTTWKLLPWQSRLLLPALMRKLDRSGVIDIGEDGEEGLAAIVEVPLEFLREGLPALLKRSVFKMAHGKFVMPNFMAAQEAKQSDAQRKRESREKQRLEAIGSQPVTSCHSPSGSQTVTGCPPVSVLVTPDQTSPDPNPDQPELDHARTRDPGATEYRSTPVGEDRRLEPRRVVARYLAIRAEEIVGHVDGAKGLSPSPPDSDVEKAAAWISGMSAEESDDIEPAIRLACRHVRRGDPGWNKPEMTKIGYLFGCIVRSWPDLREELHNCAPRPPPQADRFGKQEPPRRSTPVKFA